MKLSVRLTLAFTMLGLLAVSTVAALSWFASASEIREAADDRLRDSRAVYLSFVRSDLGRLVLENPAGNSTVLRGPETGNGAIAVLDDGVSAPDAPFEVPSSSIEAILQGEEVFETTTIDGRTYRTLTVSIDPLPVGPDGIAALRGALLYLDVTSEEQAIDDLIIRLAVLGLVAVCAVAAAGWFLGRRLALPVVELTDAVEYLAGHGTPPQRIELDRADEIGRLANRFNAMLAALEVGREQQQRLVADASHELRTPLTALRLRTEYAATFENLTPEQSRVVEGAVGDLEQLSAVVADLVDLATFASPVDEEPEYGQLVTFVAEVVERSAVATGRPVNIEADESAAFVYPAMIRSATQNLVDNALKYSPDDQPVLVRVENGSIAVRDYGSGIAPEDLASVFDRFFRSPKARNRPGNGIGLAIVQQVAETHNGSVFAANEPDGGASVGFSVAGLHAPE